MEFFELFFDDCLKLFGFQGPVFFQELRYELVLLEARLFCLKHSYFRSIWKSVLFLVQLGLYLLRRHVKEGSKLERFLQRLYLGCGRRKQILLNGELALLDTFIA